MFEFIRKYFDQKNKLWKTLLIVSIVLFLLALSFFIFSFFSHQSKLKNNNSSEITPGNQEVATTTLQCSGCIRRLIDGVYVKSEEANLPPIAVMLDNHPSARPQAGLEKANLVYEAEVEGNYTRLMAIFASTDQINEIGSVRSARSYFVDWAQEINAVYTHCGGSPEALVDLVQKDMVDLNEFYNGRYFWRTNKKIAPHNILTSSENLNKFLESKKIVEGNYTPWQFKDDTPQESTSTIRKIKINFNHQEFRISWVYDKADNDYIRYNGEKAYLTADNNLVIAKNIVIQYVSAKVVDDKLRLEMEDIGTGKTIVCQDGNCQKGEWNKKDYQSRTSFTYDNGEAVKFNAGTTWIEVVRPGVDVVY